MAKRVSKDHEERKNELLDAAQRLFVQRGYDATPVSAIIEAVGVSKGTFYHYFKSKEDLLDQQVARILENIFGKIDEVLAVGERDAVGKLRVFFAASSRWKAANRDALMAVVKPVYAEENFRLRQKLLSRSVELGVPVLEKIIRQGVAEGSMSTPFPREAAEMLISASYALGHENFRLLTGMDEHPENWELLLRRLSAYEWSAETMLGLPKGTLQITSEGSLKAFGPRHATGGETGDER